MFGNITLGQYFPGNSAVHRLDPRTKILLAGVYITLMFLVQSLAGYAAAFLFIVLGAALSGIRFKYLMKGLKPILFIIVFTVLINVLFSNKGKTTATWFTWWIFTVTDEGVITAVRMALRLIFLILGTQVMLLTTSPLALTDGIESLLNPLKKIRLPVHELAMMMTIALRFIPTLLEEADKIMKAQMARGADFESGNLLARARAMVPLLVPLFVSAFRRASDLAMAMEARCYHGGENRTRLRILKVTRLDGYASLATVALIALIVLEGILL